MSPIPLPRAPSISIAASSAGRSISRSITPPSATIPTLLSRAARAAENMLPSTALLSHINTKRQSSNGIVAIPTVYQGLNSGPAPGTVAGITLGSVAGALIILYLIFTIVTMSGRRTVQVDEEIIRRHRSSHHSESTSPARPRTRERRRRERSRSEEVVEVRERSRPPRRTSERIIVEERTRSVQPPPTAREEDDIVEVIEEHSPPRRERRSSSKRESGYRVVDPAELGGGGRPMRKVRR